MNVMILSSSKEEINDSYKSIARGISNFLARDGYDLVFGASSSSMMGICYQEFIKNGRDVYAFTTEKYIDDLSNLSIAKHYVRETTFDMKKSMFENSDIIVALPGGIGTLSEILSFIEENRSNDKNVPIVMYDEDGFYQKLFDLLEDMVKKGFISDCINEYIKVVNNYSDFRNVISDCAMKRRVR